MPNVYRLKTCLHCGIEHRKRGPFCSQAHASQYNAKPGVSVDVKFDTKKEENNGITRELLREIFEYKDGNLYWKKITHLRFKVGDKAGHTLQNGRVSVNFNKKQFTLHRLIYIYHYGNFDGYIDHINRDPTDNRIENLRVCTQQQNAANTKRKGNKLSGYAGVIKSGRYYIAQITHNKQKIIIGKYNTPEEAHQDYIRKHIELNGEFSVYYTGSEPA